MGKMQRNKGKVGEREVANILKEHGYEARRGQQFSGKNGDADVVGLDGFHIEVKRQEAYKIDDWYEQSCSDARSGEIPIVVFRKSRSKWKVIIAFEEFLEVLNGHTNL